MRHTVLKTTHAKLKAVKIGEQISRERQAYLSSQTSFRIMFFFTGVTSELPSILTDLNDKPRSANPRILACVARNWLRLSRRSAHSNCHCVRTVPKTLYLFVATFTSGNAKPPLQTMTAHTIVQAFDCIRWQIIATNSKSRAEINKC